MPCHRNTLALRVKSPFHLAAAISALMVIALPAGAQNAERPLGILFPGVQQPAPQVRSPIPTLRGQQPSTENVPRRTTQPKTQGERPLGSLINPAPSASQKSRSALPDNWASSPRRQSPPRAVDAGPAQGSASRPLGTLINLPQARTPASGPRQSATSVQAQQMRRAQKVYSPPANDATTDKPLGTLFGNQPARPAVPVIGTSSDETRPIAPAQGRKAVPSDARSPDVLRAEFNADAMTFDREAEVITATGNVEIVYGTRSVLADKITYNQKDDIVTADGNVSMTDETGKVLFGDKMEITGDLKDGVVYNIGLILEDKSRVAGAGARRSNGVITEVSQGVYSPCNLCEDDPTAPPLWQLKAVRVIHDAEQKQVSYRNAWLEIYGFPVAYTPYLSHPDPTVKRRSGFLAPSFSNSSDLGFRVQTPYFWAIDENQDATFTPLLTTDGGQGAIGQYRRRFQRAFVDADGSFVADDPDRGLRGYLDLEAEYHIDRTWRAGLDVETSSDDTYTRRYGFDTEAVLVSRGYLEGFRGQSYQAVNTYSFNDLRENSNPDDSPIVLPMYDFNYTGKRDRLGGFASFDFNALNIARDTGTDTRRLAFRPRWDRPFNGPFGELYNASVSMAADAYHASDVTRDDNSSFTGASGRVMPRASLTWRLPLIRHDSEYSQTIEPIASVVVAPNGGNDDKIPNEDSQEIEFDETNLFQDNRYDGFDRVDGGTRFNYGMNWGLTSKSGGTASVFLGQSYRPHADNTANQTSGIGENFSDFVGRVQISPQRYFDLIYRTQLSPDNFSPQRNELTTNVGGAALNLDLNYISIAQQQGSEFAGREEISGSISSTIDRNWSTRFNARHDLSAEDLRSFGVGVVYEDECVKFTTQYTRSFFEDRDLKPSDAITFTLVLKTLGEVRSGLSLSQ